MMNTLQVKNKESGSCEFLLNGHQIPWVMDYGVHVDMDLMTCTLTIALKEVQIDRSAIIKEISRKEIEELSAKNNPQA